MNSEQNEQQVLWDALDYFELKELESLDQEVRNLEQERITDALCIHEGNRSKAAKTLGIGRTLPINKIKKYNL